MTKEDSQSEFEDVGFLCECGKAFTVKQKRNYVRHLKVTHNKDKPDVGEPEKLLFRGDARNRTAERLSSKPVATPSGSEQSEPEASSLTSAGSSKGKNQNGSSSSPQNGEIEDKSPTATSPSGHYEDPDYPVRNYNDYLMGKKFFPPPLEDDSNGESDDEEWILDDVHPIKFYPDFLQNEQTKREYTADDQLKLRWVRATFRPGMFCPFKTCVGDDAPGAFSSWARMARHLVEDHCVTCPQWTCRFGSCLKNPTDDSVFIRRHEGVRHLMKEHKQNPKASRKALLDGEKLKRIFVTNAERGIRDVTDDVWAKIQAWASRDHQDKDGGAGSRDTKLTLVKDTGKDAATLATSPRSESPVKNRSRSPSPAKRRGRSTNNPAVASPVKRALGSPPPAVTKSLLLQSPNVKRPRGAAPLAAATSGSDESSAKRRKVSAVGESPSKYFRSDTADGENGASNGATMVETPNGLNGGGQEVNRKLPALPELSAHRDKQEEVSGGAEVAAKDGGKTSTFTDNASLVTSTSCAAQSPTVPPQQQQQHAAFTAELIALITRHYGAPEVDLAAARHDRDFWRHRAEKHEKEVKDLLSKFFTAFNIDLRSWDGDRSTLELTVEDMSDDEKTVDGDVDESVVPQDAGTKLAPRLDENPAAGNAGDIEIFDIEEEYSEEH